MDRGDLFKCALVKEAMDESNFEKGTNREVIWCPIFWRNLRDIEERAVSLPYEPS